jgi:hypothetical protein
MRKLTWLLAIALLLVVGRAVPAAALPYAYAGASAGAASDDELTAAFSSATAGDGTGSASAEISLAAGQMKGRASSSLAPSPSGSAAALVQGWDRFTLLGPLQGTIVDFTVSLHVTGSVDAIQTTFGSESEAAIFVDVRRADQPVTPTVALFQAGAHDSNQDPPQRAIDQVVSRSYQVLAGVPFGLSLYLHAWTRGTAVSDFSHTATLAFELPAGARVVSDAGYSSVPEPAAWLLAALGGLGLALRRIPVQTAAEQRVGLGVADDS